MTESDKKNSASDKSTSRISTTNKSAEKKSTHNKVAQAATPKTSNTTLLTFILFIVASSGGFYYFWEAKEQANNRARNFSHELGTLKQQQSDYAELSKKQLDTLQQSQKNLHTNLTNLIKGNEHLRNDWLMAEAEYLIQLANHRLLLEKDVATAIVALNAANARIAEVADPALIAVRKILSNDLQSLKNIPVIDLAGLSITLSALSNNISKLPLRIPDPNTHKLNKKTKQDSSSEAENDRGLPATIWQDIKNLIIIRNHENPIEPLLAPSQRFFLTQNLSLLLEQTRLALLNGRNEIYQERLQTAVTWITKFFDTDHNVTRNMLASLKELQKFDIDPALPDISATFSAIKKYRIKGIIPTIPKKPVAVKKEKAVQKKSDEKEKTKP